MSQKEFAGHPPCRARRGDITVDRRMATLTGPKLGLRQGEPVPCPLCRTPPRALRATHAAHQPTASREEEVGSEGKRGCRRDRDLPRLHRASASGSCSVESSARPVTRNGVGTLSAMVTAPRRHLHLCSLLSSKSSNSQSTAQHTLTQTHSFHGSVSVAFDRAPMLHMFTTHSRHD